MTAKIHPDTEIGIVSLKVANLERTVEFYVTALGFQIIKLDSTSAELGTGGTSLISLIEIPEAKPTGRTTGLYHLAILVPSRLDLAWSLNQLIKTQTPISGFADHLVSEAIYLDDPESNGIEIYRDRPKSEWLYEKGQIQMGTLPLNVEAILNEINIGNDEWPGLSPAARIGHVHLRVSAIEDSVNFYTQVLGFDLVTRYGPSAGFVSAGGYHHHIGFNTWESAGAPPPHAESPGLNWLTVDLPNQFALDELLIILSKQGIVIAESPNGHMVRDPSGNDAVLRVLPAVDMNSGAKVDLESECP